MQHISASAQEMTGISGKIISAEDRSAIDFADIYLKETTRMVLSGWKRLRGHILSQ